ncbi:iron complex outermembrane receptor protein [Sphingobium sp. B1D7B]|nr:iron complex outermembrane receptor protein [Sphingobium sp. B1D7B]
MASTDDGHFRKEALTKYRASVHKALRTGGCLLAVSLATVAHAQTAPDKATARDDIIVTATRDPSLASKTPLSITAIGGDALLKTGVTNPLGLANEVPSLEINRYYGLQITIRGVSNTDTTAKGDPSASFLLDGIYIARPQAQETSFFDVERVEVLRGPQGTLYGRNSTAGVINVITKRPTDKFEVTGNVGYGNYDTIQADAAINVPVAEGIAFRLSGQLDRRDTFIIKAPTDSFKDNPFKDNRSIRLSGKFDFNDDVSLLLVGDYSNMRGITQFNVLGDNFFAPVNGDPTNRLYVADGSADQRLRRGFNQAFDPYVNNAVYGVMGELSWNLGPVTATYLGSYRRLDVDEKTTDYLGGVSPTLTTQKYEQNSHEFRLALNDVSGLKLQAGLMYFNEHSMQYYDQPNYYGFDHFILDYGPTKATSYAAFGQATYSVTDRLRLTGGLRYTHDKKSQQGNVIFQITGLPDTVLVSGTSVDFSKLTWRVGADFDLDDRTMLFASVATGYKSGGFNDGCLAGSVIGGRACNQPLPASVLIYQPEEITSYEGGIKGWFADNAVRYSLSTFYYDYRNLQLNSTAFIGGAPTLLIQNAGKAKVFGVEAEATLRPSPRNRFDLMASFLDAKFRSYMPQGPSGPDFAGKPLDRSPGASVTVGYTYTLPLGDAGSLDLGARTKISDSYVVSSYSSGIQWRQPAYTRTEVQATYHAPGDRWYLQAYGRNLENNVLLTAQTYIAGAMAVVPGDPLTYGVRAGFNF